MIRIVIILLSMAVAGCGTKSTDEKEIKAENTKKTITQPKLPADAVLAPNFKLATTAGKIVQLNDLKGKVVLVNFWGTWCGPCRQEIPDLNKLYEKYHKDGLEIVGVTLTSGTADQIQSFALNWKMIYTLLTDIQGNETQNVTTDFGKATRQPIVGIPTTFLIDRNGYIVKRYLGPRSEEIFYNDIKPYL